MGLETQPWWNELVSKKDTLSLRELAEEFGTTAGAISVALKMTNTSRVPQGLPQGLPPEAGDSRPGSKDQLIEPYRNELGQVPDSDIAEKAGVSVRTIASYRSRNQIPGYQGRTTPTKPRKRRRSKIDPFANIVGKVADRIVAEKAGVTLNAVRNYRAARGIISARQRSQEERAAPVSRAVETPPPVAPQAPAPAVTTPAPAVAAPAPVAPVAAPIPAVNGIGFAWRIRFETGRVGIVTGSTVVDAASVAAHSGHGHVVGIERVGALL